MPCNISPATRYQPRSHGQRANNQAVGPTEHKRARTKAYTRWHFSLLDQTQPRRNAHRQKDMWDITFHYSLLKPSHIQTDLGKRTCEMSWTACPTRTTYKRTWTKPHTRCLLSRRAQTQPRVVVHAIKKYLGYPFSLLGQTQPHLNTQGNKSIRHVPIDCLTKLNQMKTNAKKGKRCVPFPLLA